jgi:hypothetical protein
VLQNHRIAGSDAPPAKLRVCHQQSIERIPGPPSVESALEPICRWRIVEEPAFIVGEIVDTGSSLEAQAPDFDE